MEYKDFIKLLMPYRKNFSNNEGKVRLINKGEFILDLINNSTIENIPIINKLKTDTLSRERTILTHSSSILAHWSKSKFEEYIKKLTNEDTEFTLYKKLLEHKIDVTYKNYYEKLADIFENILEEFDNQKEANSARTKTEQDSKNKKKAPPRLILLEELNSEEREQVKSDSKNLSNIILKLNPLYNSLQSSSAQNINPSYPSLILSDIDDIHSDILSIRFYKQEIIDAVEDLKSHCLTFKSDLETYTCEYEKNPLIRIIKPSLIPPSKEAPIGLELDRSLIHTVPIAANLVNSQTTLSDTVLRIIILEKELKNIAEALCAEESTS